MIFQQGHYYLGAADLPFYVSVGMLQDGAETEGFDQVQIWDAKDFPLPFAPSSSKPYTHVAIARYIRETRSIKLPKQVAWVYDVSPPAPGPQLPPSSPDAPPRAPSPVMTPTKPPIAKPSPAYLVGYWGALGIVLGAAVYTWGR